MGQLVNVDSFVRAETARMFDGILAQAGGVNRWMHLRGPVPLDRQAVIRMNRDTLYSSAVVNIEQGARLAIPDCGDRYVSVMVVNEDHYVNAILRDPGQHRLGVEEFDTPFVDLSVRLFVDPSDPGDVAEVNALQDQFVLEAGSARPYSHPDYDADSLDATRAPLLTLAQSLSDARATFGSRGQVDAVRHLIGTAYGWGGLPEQEAFYVVDSTPRPLGHYRLTLRDVPVDAFWSLTVYNADGYFEPNAFDSYNVNSITARPHVDGTVTVDLAPTPDGYRNHLYVMDGWNYALRFYRPRPPILDGSWPVPAPRPVE